ncbi:apolipoprotein N-acyltransferase [Trinickia sp. LjRoot230]|uniref:apolipoprotein N-acyltransferase n=1 Tax=Trinickia sp. LjRoot230 TaxID=3342288 RepID=UPI003ECE142D
MVESISSRARRHARAAPGATHAARPTLFDARALPRWHYLVALAAGALNTLSFAPTPHGGWLALALLAFLYAWLTRTTGWKSAALTGGAFGFGNFVTGVWWLYVSMHDYGGMAAPLAGAALVLFSLYLALYPALAAGLWSRCAARADSGSGDAAQRVMAGWYSALAFASAWALGEWLRGTVFTGFPWLASGYAQVDGPLAGFAALGGVYGVAWMAALAAALVVQALHALMMGQGRRRPALLPALAACALLACGIALAGVSWTTPADGPLSVRILQGNVKQEMKFDEAGVTAAVALYQRMITEKPADLIITPETAVPLLPQQFPEPFGRAVRTFADSTGSSILLGGFGATITPDGRMIDPTNSLFGITPKVNLLYRYDKHHLVPFGEFVPWGFHWFVQLMNIPLGDLARGKPVQPAFQVRNQRVDVDICYEDIFGEEIARNLREAARPASMLVNVSNLAWFGNTIALDQHLQMARMRTLETGRPLVAATNTGTTAAIDARGRITARLPALTLGSLDVAVQGMTGRTPYITAGNSAVLIGSLVLLALGFVRRRHRRGGDGIR